MYECYNAKRFFRLLMLDIIIFSICLVFFLIGKNIVCSAEEKNSEERIFLPAVMYNNIQDGTSDNYTVTAHQLENDLRYLNENGYTAVSAQQLTDYICGKYKLPEKPVVITFDEGFYNNPEHIISLLEKYNMYAIVPAPGSNIDNSGEKSTNDSYISYMTWNDLCTLSGSAQDYISHNPDSLYDISCYNRSGKYSTEEFMNKALAKE